MKTIKVKHFIVIAIALVFLIVFYNCGGEQEISDPLLCKNYLQYRDPFQFPIDPRLERLKGQQPNEREEAFQSLADELSWMEFIALNWPSLSNGVADTTKCIGLVPDEKTVWLGWKEISEIFETKKKLNIDSNSLFISEAYIQKSGTRNFTKSNLLLHQTELPEMKVEHHGITRENEPSVIDQNGNPVLFQTYFNKPMAEYIEKGGLNSEASAENFVTNWPDLNCSLDLENRQTGSDEWINMRIERIYFPFNVHKGSTDAKKIDTLVHYHLCDHGAVVIKVAWKVLEKGEDLSKFYTKKAVILHENQTPDTATVGMVAMHIAHKFAEQPRWLWSTFEHIDNVPEKDAQGIVRYDKTKKYNFFDPSSKDSVNVPPKDPSAKSQLAREYPMSDTAKKWNDTFHKRLKNMAADNVWQNYILIGTQWNTSQRVLPRNPYSAGDPRPINLANAIIENFSQKNSSCAGCHSRTEIIISGERYSADLVRGLERINKK